MLGQRIITALILLPLVVLGILKLDSDIFSLIIAIILMAGGTEWCRMAGLKKRIHLVLFLLVLALSLWVSWINLGDGDFVRPILIAAALWWLLALVWVLVYPRGHGFWYGPLIIRAISGLLVLVPTFIAMAHLQAQVFYGPERLLFLMVLIWVADSGAYFAGRSLGRHKLAPRVSPGKSWEGVLGGVIAALVVAWAVTLNFDIGIHFGPYAVIPFTLLILFSVLGDLTQSMYKRQAGIKDSGHILPGHGGVMDRIDSLTSAAPLFLLALMMGWL
ncbi:MAG: phosphatidate cytidylyltransferase [Gammaproteobacteria bacterium]|nr:phosphatidate cytidylyltransferase [Gammaproteobacteria bacterium]